MSPFPEDWIPWLWPASVVLLAACVACVLAGWRPERAHAVGVATGIVALLCRLRMPGWLGDADGSVLAMHVLTLGGVLALCGLRLARLDHDPAWALLAAVPVANILLLLATLAERPPRDAPEPQGEAPSTDAPTPDGSPTGEETPDLPPASADGAAREPEPASAAASVRAPRAAAGRPAPGWPAEPPSPAAGRREARRRALRAVGVGSVLSGVLAVSIVFRLAEQERSYGWELFVLAPLVVSLLVSSAFHHGARRTWTALGWLGLGMMLVSGLLILAFGLEGLICLVMALPLIAVVIAAGLLVGRLGAHLLSRRSHRAPPALALALVPLLMSALASPELEEDPLFIVTTAVEIDAPPELVWPHVVAYDWIPEPDNPLFGAVFARPLRAVIDGEGRGARRACVFDTGAFEEVVEVWEPNERLRFAVVSNPPPMRELNPFHDVDAPHLHGFYQSRAGEYRIEALPGGRTRLVGTSWYQHGLKPAGYWRLWTDLLVRQVHGMVLGHVKTLAEQDAAS